MATKAFQKIYTKITQITKATCSLKAANVGNEELATVDGKLAQVVKIIGDEVTLQVFGGTEGLRTNAEVVFMGKAPSLNVGDQLIGRFFNAFGDPIDGGPVPEGKEVEIGGPSVNPVRRKQPSELIATGIAGIDLNNTLVSGQKIPFFADPDQPYNQVMANVALRAQTDKIINCYYKPGPSTKTNHNRRSMIIGIGANTTDSARPKWGKYYIAGNWCSSLSDTYKLPTDSYERNTCLDNWNYGVYNNISEPISAQEKAAMRLSEPNNPGLVTTHTAQVAFEKVLGTAGCSLQRDEIDLRIVDETRRGTATFKGNFTAVGGIIDSQNDLKPAGAGSDWSPWPTLNSTDPPKDTDQDGMPDAWEEARGLNPRYPLDRNDIAENGYTNLENYLNSLVEEIVRQELSDYEFVTGSGQNDLPTAINPPVVAKQIKENNKVWYDLSGQAIESPNARGLYIRRGEKIVIR
jgi:hypothetical protein